MRNQIIEECAAAIEQLLRKDEATAQQSSITAGYATSAYRGALQEAIDAIRTLKSKSDMTFCWSRDKALTFKSGTVEDYEDDIRENGPIPR